MIRYIDSPMGAFKESCAVYVVGRSEFAIIETGTAASAPQTITRLGELPGFDPLRVKYILPTHLHLDHAGGASQLAEYCPNATILLHKDTYKHLIDPTRLYESTERTDPMMARLYGKPLPVPESRIQPLESGAIVQIKEAEIEVVDSPGHHSAHHAFLERDSNTLFTGDSIGWYWREHDVILPTTPPPRFDYIQYRKTIQKFINLSPETLSFTHFGETKEKQCLETAIETCEFWYKTIAKLRAEDPEITPREVTGMLMDNYYPEFRKYPELLISMALEVPVKGMFLYQDKDPNVPRIGVGHA